MRQCRWVGLLLMGLLLAGCGGARTSPAPDLDLPLQTLDGEVINLSDYAGQVILVNFWATWCGPCREEMPELERFYRDHRRAGLTLLAVNAGEPAQRVRAYIADGGYTFLVLLDRDGAVADHFGGVRGMPTTIVYDRSGSIAYRHVGPLNRDILDTQVAPLLP